MGVTSYLVAVAAVAAHYAERGSPTAAVVARRAPACRTLDDFDRTIAPALDEYGDDLPEPLRALLADRPTGAPCAS